MFTPAKAASSRNQGERGQDDESGEGEDGAIRARVRGPSGAAALAALIYKT